MIKHAIYYIFHILFNPFYLNVNYTFLIILFIKFKSIIDELQLFHTVNTEYSKQILKHVSKFKIMYSFYNIANKRTDIFMRNSN